MVTSDLPPDENDKNSKQPDEEGIPDEAASREISEEPLSSQNRISIDKEIDSDDIQLDEIEGLDNNDFRPDTLEFESISRRPKRRTFGLKLILLFFVVGIGGYFSWMQWGDTLSIIGVNELPFVKAPEKAFKVRPKEPGGKDFPNRDKLVYDRLDRKPSPIEVENILPRPEVPLLPSRLNKERTEELTASAKMRKLPPNTIGSQPTTDEVRAVSKPPMSFNSPKLKNNNTQNTLEPSSSTNLASSINPASGASADPATSNQRVNSYQIQLAAVRTNLSAEKEWLRLRTKNKTLLNKLKLNIVRADLGKQGIFFRLRAGPLASQASAKTLCQELARKKVGCLVIAPTK